MIKISNTSKYLPVRTEDNDYFSKILKLDVSPEWIVNKTGILTRHYAAFDQLTSDLAYMAYENMKEEDPSTIELLIIATTTTDMAVPSVSGIVQKKIGCSCPCIEINSGCAGFVYAFDVAYHYIQTYKKILVIGADTITRLIDYSDNVTPVFFGDGAGAVMLERSSKKTILSRFISTRGNVESISTQKNGKVEMNGRDIWNFVLEVFPDTVNKLLNDAALTISDVDWIVPHQANIKMIKAAVEKLNFPFEKTIINADKYGNTVAASIPMALHDGISDGRIKEGDKIILIGYGAGLSWGGILMEYQK